MRCRQRAASFGCRPARSRSPSRWSSRRKTCCSMAGHGHAHQERQRRGPAGDRHSAQGPCRPTRGRSVARAAGQLPPHRQRKERPRHPGHARQRDLPRTASPSATTAATASGWTTATKTRGSATACSPTTSSRPEPARLPRHRRLRQPVRGEPGRPALHRQLQPVHDRQQPRRPPAARRRDREHLRLGRLAAT